jgi:hypothetical protein
MGSGAMILLRLALRNDVSLQAGSSLSLSLYSRERESMLRAAELASVT